MIVAVNAMGFTMFFKHDPTFLLRGLVVFLILGLVVFAGFFYILRNFKTKDSPVRE
jgi:hypothetical protein